MKRDLMQLVVILYLVFGPILYLLWHGRAIKNMIDVEWYDAVAFRLYAITSVAMLLLYFKAAECVRCF